MLKHISRQVQEAAWINDDAQLYGSACAAVMAPLHNALQECAQRIVGCFYASTLQLTKSRPLLERLSADEVKRMHFRQEQSLLLLASPDLTAVRHREMAMQTGRIHSVMGLEHEDLIVCRDLLAASICHEIDTAIYAEAFSLLMRRLTRGLAIQTEAYQSIQGMRHEVITSITRIVAEARAYGCLMTDVAKRLGEHTEIAGCWVGRPDPKNRFRFEAVSGEHIQQFLELVEANESDIVFDQRHLGQGPVGIAWRQGQIQRVMNLTEGHYREAAWRDAAVELGFRSLVVIPIRREGREPKALLVFYSRLPGAFSSTEQKDFVGLLQMLLELAVTRLEQIEGSTAAIPYLLRERWSGLLQTDALHMHYQPLLDLKTGKVTKVEALARLQDQETLLAPGQFFPALSTRDFLNLFVRGLGDALRQRNEWLSDGLDLGVSVNLPPAALSDSRYFDATKSILEEHSCAPGKLTLEVLETEALPHATRIADEIGRFKSLGIKVAQDDLGAGHSSLNRLRELPFDLIKLDRSIVSLEGQDSSDVLRFIYQLTRLGHTLGKSVVVEGVEDLALLDALVTLGVDFVQGYGIARPMPAAHMAPWMSGRAELRDSCQPQHRLSKLARLLIWEEGMHLNVEVPREAQQRYPAAAGSQNESEESQPDSQLSAPVIDNVPALLKNAGCETARMALLDAALASGMTSEAYLSARRDLIAQM